MEVIPRLPTLYDEPYADSSQIRRFWSRSSARRHVKVSISATAPMNCSAVTTRYFWGRRLEQGLLDAALCAPVARQGVDRSSAPTPERGLRPR